jgi:ubiquinone/menaquinone biosynthesis C-methylase UbiE
MSTDKAPQATGAAGLFSGSSFADVYEQELVGPIFDPWVAPLLDDAHLSPGDRVLDVACGTGIVARRARERLGQTGAVVGIDVNPQMLTVARRMAPSVDWREGDATSLPLGANETFDVVLCQQGFQFFSDRMAAAGELRRALADGGRLAVSTWRSDEESPVLLQLRKVAEAHVGPIADRRHGLGDPSALEAALEDAGFHEIRTDHHTRTMRFADGRAFLHLNAMALVSMSDFRTQSDEERQKMVTAIARASEEQLSAQMEAGALAYQLGANVVLARA